MISKFSLDPIHLIDLSVTKKCLTYFTKTHYQGLIPDDIYEEILRLHIGYSILSSPKHANELMNIADELLKLFVENFGQIFGDATVTFNVHNFVHLAKCVNDFGITSSFSAYSFEKFSYQIKRKIRKPTKNLGAN
ncbi:uncharacterized protein LOC131995556 [Stomoxys calcitrans]|uniref:uncharacterized protein LOC131995556 n=1 Tax=Stomoxys calcitrans TaxID=35570 RepID=UPI0027E2D733|nr:uncharacterized protein LOC131995556 [Stomoxys calcitrans]